jgi:hypothetical protein
MADRLGAAWRILLSRTPGVDSSDFGYRSSGRLHLPTVLLHSAGYWAISGMINSFDTVKLSVEGYCRTMSLVSFERLIS